jgi:transposase
MAVVELRSSTWLVGGAGRDGFRLARWLRARGVEAYGIHPTSIAVSREHRRAKNDRLDVGLLKRSFLGSLRGMLGHLM